MKKERIILLALLLGAIAYFLLAPIGEQAGATSHSEELIELQKENDSLKLANVQLDQEIEEITSRVDSLLELTLEDQKQIENLKRKENESLKAIDSFNNIELFNFFARLNTDSTASR